MEWTKLCETPDFTLYIADDAAGEWEVWIDDVAVIGSAPTRRQAVKDAILTCRSMAEALAAVQVGAQ